MNEEIVRFGRAHALVGILTRPPDAAADPELPVVILLNAGLLHRIGPNRLYVQIARVLAGLGFTVLRFDFSGIGDSLPRADHLPYIESAPAEVRDAMDWLTAHNGARRFILMGHCSGAGFSYLLASQDERVAGAAIINFEGGSEEWVEFDRRRKVSRQVVEQYSRRLTPAHWAKLLSGRADYRSIVRSILKDVIWYRLTTLAFRVQQLFGRRQAVSEDGPEAQAQAGLRRMVDRGVALLFIHAEGSTGQSQVEALLGPEIKRLQNAGKLHVAVIPQSDHLFTLVARQRLVGETLAEWAQSIWRGTVAPTC